MKNRPHTLRKHLPSVVGTLAALVLSISASTAAHADILFLGPSDLGGQGIGSVSTVLSLTSPGSSTTEFASVGRNAAGTLDVLSGDIAAGGNTQTRLLSDLGITQASTLRIILNLNEPGSDPRVTLTDLTLNAYNGGTLVFSGSYTGPDLNLTVAGQGIGNSGYFFSLDATQAAALQSALTVNTRIGLSARLINAEGGFETLSVGRADGTSTVSAVGAAPEPGSLALLGAGFLGLLPIVARRRRK